MAYRGRRVAVVMPAYNAARTLRQTYRDLPHDIVDDVIVVDDASRDETVAVARTLPVHVVVHPENRGYGGNQKTCYRTAVARGADVIVMVHPDHQYDPAFVPELVRAVVDDGFLAVFGSRMARWSGALQGGMPWWKFLANIVLTQFCNLALGTRLSEYHSGFRAYDRRVFDLVDVSRNSDDFVFDTQIIIQLADRGLSIGEVPISTRYFDEASQINFRRSVVYGCSIVAAVVAYKLGWKRL
jgi:glycosyltransferase involved in cell wall biosynthesis